METPNTTFPYHTRIKNVLEVTMRDGNYIPDDLIMYNVQNKVLEVTMRDGN